jgi:hypothetical protein
MHAALVNVTIDPEAADDARTNLRDQVVPMVSGSPGFVAGYWLEPQQGKALSIVVFDTEEQARQTAPPAGSSPFPGVTIDSLEFRAVAEGASR